MNTGPVIPASPCEVVSSTAGDIRWALRNIAHARSIWEPHWGCAVLAGHGILARNLVEEEARPCVRKLIDSIRLAHPDIAVSIRDNDGECGSREDFLSLLGQPEGTSAVHEIGHDWIYAGYILNFHGYGRQGNPGGEEDTRFWTGAARLIRTIRQSGPGWITINGSRTILPVPVLSESATGVAGDMLSPLSAPADFLAAFAGLDRAADMERGDMQRGHLLTHGHAAFTLHRLGFEALAKSASEALRARLGVLAQANALQQTAVQQPGPGVTSSEAPLHLPADPKKAEFWEMALSRWTGGHGHLLKYAYSFLDLSLAATSAEVRAASLAQHTS